MANETTTTKNDKVVKDKTEEVKVENVAPCSQWITVTSCVTYYLCGDNYLNENGDYDTKKLMEATDKFDDAKGC
ncbi:hypothetical protein [Empedobacter stercoris]|uniref:hypothetical protein n=1 Tax=Empedobacter stercoris TaxID=1628248 RepID=UPI001CE09431|nr:hypothetical protein [Empedobacter stercoris]MCA4777160.1 hypothetical protein [Empedobacter stercoris]